MASAGRLICRQWRRTRSITLATTRCATHSRRVAGRASALHHRRGPGSLRTLQSRAMPTIPPTDRIPQRYTGPSKAEVLATRQQYLNPGIFKYYQSPVMIVEGQMQYLWDETGRRYLDQIGGIATVNVGHCHPYVTEKVKQQLETLQHSTSIYLNPEIGEYAKELVAELPPHLTKCYFVNSGSEANDLALLMARAHTGSSDVVGLRYAYHGMSTQAMGLTGQSSWKYPVLPATGVHHAACPDPYRGNYGDDAEAYAKDVLQVIQASTCGKIAAFFAESIMGVGGTIVFPQGYLERVYAIVRDHGGVCVADEVQTGFGRTGTQMWGFEKHGVLPDIVTMAKGIGNGIPLAAVVTTDEIANTLSQRIHFNTYGGNPVAMAAGRAVLHIIKEDGHLENVAKLGQQYLQGLQQMSAKHECVGHVRGEGLMLGVEYIDPADPAKKIPHASLTATIFEKCKDMGLLVGKGGFFGNVIRIKPPFCLTSADVEFALAVLDQATAEAVRELS